jgi:DNA/RNA endonuclease YhcR with UshA esterase domain
MASGFLGKANPAANTWNNIYTVPDNTLASISINAVNGNGNACTVDFAVSTSSASTSIATAEYIERSAFLDSLGAVLERTGIVTDATNGKYVWVRSTNDNTSFQVYGYEE